MYSFSRLSAIEECPYQAYLAYIEKNEHAKDNVWNILGEAFHDALEEITNSKSTPDILSNILIRTLTSLEILGMEFPKDMQGNDSIRMNWISNMNHFCSNFKGLGGSFKTEELIIYHTDNDKYVIGYADLIQYNDDGTISILDWKTSSLYKKDALEHAAHQLAIYGLALEQAGLNVRDLSWVFLKYAEVNIYGLHRANAKNKTWKKCVVERRKIYETIQPHIYRDLTDQGYSQEDIHKILKRLESNPCKNNIPSDIADNYQIDDYILTIPFDDEQKIKTKEYVKNQIEEFEKRTIDEKEWKHKDFYKYSKNGKKYPDTFYCNALCSYGHICKYIREFNDKLESQTSRRKENANKQFEDVFSLLE